jgi:hypothetical protein
MHILTAVEENVAHLWPGRQNEPSAVASRALSPPGVSVARSCTPGHLQARCTALLKADPTNEEAAVMLAELMAHQVGDCMAGYGPSSCVQMHEVGFPVAPALPVPALGPSLGPGSASL